MPTLHITDDSGKEVLRVTIKDIEPTVATVAIFGIHPGDLNVP